MRHGEAELYAVSDKARHLTDRGRLQVRAKAETSKTYLAEVDTILHSPYSRAVETAHIMAEALQIKSLSVLEQWTPDAEPSKAIASLESFAEQNPLIVTHMPLISYVEALLCEASVSSPAGFNCAEVVAIDVEWPAIGLGVRQARF